MDSHIHALNFLCKSIDYWYWWYLLLWLVYLRCGN